MHELSVFVDGIRSSLTQGAPSFRFLVYDVWFRVENLGSRAWGRGLRVLGLGLRVEGSGFRVKGLRFGV